MNFLAPWFLLGGLAAVLPVVFHLVRRSSREKMVFSSLMFLKPTPPRMTRRNRLEDILLLLLRCLVILLLSVGFARPFFQKPMAAAASDQSASRIVLLVDTSASMRREGLWPAALARADAALHALSPADEAAVLTFDDQVRSLVSFEQWVAMGVSERAALTAQRLASTQPTWRSTHLGNALIAAADLLEDAGKREPFPGPQRIELITDLQEGSRLDGLQGYQWPRGVEVAVDVVKGRRPTNAGIHWVLNADDSSGVASGSGVRLRVSNSADSEREQFQIRWDGIAGAASLDAYVPPGQSRIVPAPKLPAGVAGERLVLSGDDNDFDNLVYVVQPKAEEVNVVYLGDDAENDPAQMLYYLERAFQDTRRQIVRVLKVASAMPLPASLLATNRLAIVSSTLPPERIAEVRRFLSEGGAALLVMKDAGLSRTLGQLAGAPETRATEAGVANYAMFGPIDFENPLFAPFADPRFSDFTKIRFWKHRKLQIDAFPAARVIARFDDDDPAIVEIPAGRGRIVVFAFSWRPAESQMALSSKFVPLLYSILDQAGGLKAQLAQYRVGDPVDLSALAASVPSAALTLRKPDGSQVELDPGGKRFLGTDEPGIYQASAGPAAVRFAVNLDPSESRTAPLPVEELERLNVPMKPRDLPVSKLAARRQQLHDADLENRQKLWRGLIVAALVVLMGETWLAGRRRRRAAQPVEAAA